MKAIIFVKKSVRLPGKHSLDLCGRKIIQRVCDSLTSVFNNEVIIYSKDPDIYCGNCSIIPDKSTGILLDSIISALEIYEEFLAVGGDMPFLGKEIINLLLNNYDGDPVAIVSDDKVAEPLFAIYNKKILGEMIDYSKDNRSIYPFIEKRFKLVIAGNLSGQLLSINTDNDLKRAREVLGCI